MKSPYSANSENQLHTAFLPEDFINKHGLILILGLSGILGFAMGLAYSTWHVVVETAQVIAGLVHYAKDNPFYIYHVKVWTILNQLGALALYCGMTEKSLTVILSGLMGMLSFQALSLFTFSLCQNVPISLALPFFMQFTQVMAFGINYPIQILGFSHTYGVFGLTFCVLVIALFSSKHYRSGGVCLGLTPAIHPVMGGFLSLTLLAILLWDFERMRAPFFRAIKYFIAGCLLSGIGFALHMLITYDVPVVDSATKAKYISAVVRYWDPHRKPVNLLSVNFYLCILSPITCFALLRLGRDKLPEHFILPLRILVITGLIGVAACLMSHVPPGVIPPRIMRIMPTRIFGINIITLVPLLVGIAAYHKNDTYHQLNLFFLLAVLAVILSLHPPQWGKILMIVITLSALIMVARIIAIHSTKALINPSSLATGSLILLLTITAAEAVKASASKNDILDWRNDSLFAQSHKGQGVLLVGPGIYGFIQLHAGRPVFPGLPLDGLPYAPEAGPSFDKALKEVYGVDLFNPPEESKMRIGLPVQQIKTLWESRTLEDWQRIKAGHNLTDIFTYGDWQLQLPVTHPPEWKTPGGGQRGYYMLYHIP